MKLYSLLTLTKYTKNIKTFKSTEKDYFQVVYYYVNKTVCSIQHIIPQILNNLDGGIKAYSRSHESRRRCANNHHLGVQVVCMGYLWIHNVDKKMFF